MSKRIIRKGVWRSTVIFISVLVAACTNPVEEIVLRSQAPDRVNGFSSGEKYATTRPMYLVRQGAISALVPQTHYRITGSSQGEDLRVVTTGTSLKVTSIKGSNTLTHGSMFWPECRILTGTHKGVRASLGHKEAPRCVRRVQ